MTQTIKKLDSPQEFNNLSKIEALRKKLSMEREFHNSILVKNGFIYCSNGFYLVKVKAIAIEDGCLQNR